MMQGSHAVHFSHSDLHVWRNVYSLTSSGCCGFVVPIYALMSVNLTVCLLKVFKG